MKFLRQLGPAVLTVFLIAGFIYYMKSHEAGHHVATEDEAHGDGERSDAPTIVQLSLQKQAFAKIKTEPVKKQLFQQQTVVPGRLEYDDTNHIDVKAAAGGIITQVKISPGTKVIEGDVLAIVSSPDVGAARADVLKGAAELHLKRQRAEFEKQSNQSLVKIVELIRSGAEPNEILEQVSNISFGGAQGELLGAYSRYRLANSLADALNRNSNEALSARLVQERLSDRDSTQASLRAAVEKTLFESQQAQALAQAEAENSQVRLRLSQQALVNLIGQEESLAAINDSTDLSLLEIRAPISGTIESRMFSRLERVQQVDTLFVLANTNTLWVAADIREQQWQALQLEPGQAVKVSSPAIPRQTFDANVLFIGREVNELTNAVSLTALIHNEHCLLRPGQFVNVEMPVGKSREVICIPESAIAEHDGQKFVFVQEGPEQFRRRNVKTGHRSSGVVEIEQGVSVGENLIVEGVFELKSELVLDRSE